MYRITLRPLNDQTMSKLMFFFLAVLLAWPAFSQTLSVPGGTSGISNNTFNGNVGIGTIPSGFSRLHIYNSGSTFLNLDKASISFESGIQFSKAGNVLFYLYSDDTNDALKIQGTSQSGENDGSPRMEFPFSNRNIHMALSGGSVGIGTNSLTERLTISGGGIALDADQPIRGAGKWLISGNAGAVMVGSANTGVNLRLMAGDGNPRIFVDGTSGGVGIGTQSMGSYKLAVQGKIGAHEINVTTNGWSDYVFHSDYKLRPLSEVQQYIKENHHLPEVPSEKEVLTNGQNLGEMNAILLKKIEELTLYVIELEKENDNLKTRVERIERK
jgi:hypothetical protein